MPIPHAFIRALSAGLVALAATVAQAIEVKPYTAAALGAAQQAGKPVALHFHADWCPTCRQQQAAIEALKADPKLNLTLLVANFDTEKALRRDFGVRYQSTFVVLRGKTETARLTGETAVEKIRAALASAL
jgi:thiol-disulfide isomerase/thioredoxin